MLRKYAIFNAIAVGFDAAPARIGDTFFSDQVRMYRARAKLYQFVSLVLLAITAILISFGVRTFVQGDSGDDVLAKEEVDIQVLLRRKQEELNSIDTEAVNREQALTIMLRAKVLSGILARTKSGILGFRDQPTPSLLSSVGKVVGAGLDIVQKVIASQQQQQSIGDVEIIVSEVAVGESNAFPVESLRIVRETASENSIDLGRLSSQLAQLSQELARLKQTSLAKEEMAKFATIVDGLDIVSKLDAIHSSVTQKADKARSESDEGMRRSPLTLAKKQDLQNEIKKLEQELTETRQRREKILFMAWIPGLTLRVGTVILLLFLTQILLASYRYTVAISAFYLARSDAIQLVQPTPDQPLAYRIEDLGILIGLLTPSSHNVEPVKDPTDQFTDLAKAWIGRKS